MFIIIDSEEEADTREKITMIITFYSCNDKYLQRQSAKKQKKMRSKTSQPLQNNMRKTFERFLLSVMKQNKITVNRSTSGKLIRPITSENQKDCKDLHQKNCPSKANYVDYNQSSTFHTQENRPIMIKNISLQYERSHSPAAKTQISKEKSEDKRSLSCLWAKDSISCIRNRLDPTYDRLITSSAEKKKTREQRVSQITSSLSDKYQLATLKQKSLSSEKPIYQKWQKSYERKKNLSSKIWLSSDKKFYTKEKEQKQTLPKTKYEKILQEHFKTKKSNAGGEPKYQPYNKNDHLRSIKQAISRQEKVKVNQIVKNLPQNRRNKKILSRVHNSQTNQSQQFQTIIFQSNCQGGTKILSQKKAMSGRRKKKLEKKLEKTSTSNNIKVKSFEEHSQVVNQHHYRRYFQMLISSRDEKLKVTDDQQPSQEIQKNNSLPLKENEYQSPPLIANQRAKIPRNSSKKSFLQNYLDKLKQKL